jgi:hypothetical protein
MFDKENNLHRSYIYNIYQWSDMHDNDGRNNLNVSMLFLCHLLYDKRKVVDIPRIEKKKNFSYRNSCLSCSGVPNISRHRGHLIVFSPIETWWSSQTFIHLTWTLFPQPCLEKKSISWLNNQFSFLTNRQ